MADTNSSEQSAKVPTVFDAGLEQLGTTYAKALLSATEGAGTTEDVLEEFQSFVEDVLEKLPQLDAALESPRVPLESKERMLDAALLGKASDVFVNFLKVVARHGRFNCLRAILRATQQQYNELRGRIEVRVTTAVAVDESTLQGIADKLKESLGKDVEISTTVDEKLIGGVVIRVGDKVFDGSVVSRLGQVRRQAVNNTIEQIRDSIGRFEIA